MESLFELHSYVQEIAVSVLEAGTIIFRHACAYVPELWKGMVEKSIHIDEKVYLVVLLLARNLVCG
jgi:hypothetical protein